MNAFAAKILIWCLLAGWLVTTPTASAFTSADADEIFAAYNRAFFFTNGNMGFYRKNTNGGKTWFWERAEQMEMILDVHERTKNPACLTLFSNLFNGFIADHGTNWSRNEFHDDIMWMVIACARATKITGNQNFHAAAKNNFDLCYARAWSTNLGGGLWWKIDNRSKNACVNGPAAIAAYLLYQIGGDTNYLTKAENIFQWERATLFDAATGQVYDAIRASGQSQRWASSYNQGTFIGAANFLGHTNDARLAADYTENILSSDGLLPQYKSAGDTSGFNGICVRWLARFMKERGLESSYEKWLQANADAAWKSRRKADNLAWPRWHEPTPSGILDSWACSSAVVMLQVATPDEKKSTNSKTKN